MVESCECPTEAGNAVCETALRRVQEPSAGGNLCPHCRQAGKPVQGQTVKALVSVSLRTVPNFDYLFCRTQTCPVVYFAAGVSHTFTVDQVRERVYQKEPDAGDVFVCYCFRHTVDEVRTAPVMAEVILVDVQVGIQAGQCACDIRNPQGSCCLGNLRGLIKRLAGPASERVPNTGR